MGGGIKLMTLADYAEDHDFHARCPRCLNMMPYMDRQLLIEKIGGDTLISEVDRYVDCKTCGGHGCDVTVTYRGRMGTK